MRAHVQLTERSLRTPIGKGREGKGDRKGSRLRMLRRLTGPTGRPVDNFAAATADRISRVACESIDRRWFR